MCSAGALARGRQHHTFRAMRAQVKYVVGYSIPHVDRLQDILYNLAANAGQFRRAEAAMGAAWIALLLAIKNAPRWHKCAAATSPSPNPVRRLSRPAELPAREPACAAVCATPDALHGAST